MEDDAENGKKSGLGKTMKDFGSEEASEESRSLEDGGRRRRKRQGKTKKLRKEKSLMKLASEAQDEDALRWFDFLRKFLEEDESIRESIRELHSKKLDLSGETLSVAAFPRTDWRGAEEIDETEVVAFRQLHRSHDLSGKTSKHKEEEEERRRLQEKEEMAEKPRVHGRADASTAVT